MSTKSKIIFSVSERIKNLRQEKGITQEELSRRSRVDYKHIQLIEGKSPPAIRIDTLEKIVRGFNMEVHEFFNDQIFLLPKNSLGK